MANPTETTNERMWSVPEFGGWDKESPGSTNYSMVFSEARAKRKQQKAHAWCSLGNEIDFTAVSLPQHNHHSVTADRKQQKACSLGNEQDFVTAFLPAYRQQPEGRDVQDSVTNSGKVFDPKFVGGSDDKTVEATENSMPSSGGQADKKQQKTDVTSPHRQVNNHDDSIQSKRWMSVPEFGGWDQEPSGSKNYSMLFTEARANRKQAKSDVFSSLGNEQDLAAATSAPHPPSHRQNNARTSVPEFGGWDRNDPGSTNYTMVFSQARANRKQQKSDGWRSLGNEQDLVPALPPQRPRSPQDKVYRVSKRKKIMSFITSCIRPW